MNVEIQVHVAGEDMDGSDPAPIVEAFRRETGTPVTVCAPGRLGPIRVAAGQPATVDVRLNEPLHCALRLSFWEV